jgi:menaquinone-dependent protoporphyrinogen oxidase
MGGSIEIMIGFIYSTVDGHTLEICERLKTIAESRGFDARLLELTPEVELDLDSFDQLVIGASIRYGKHRPELFRLIRANAKLLEAKHAAFFSVNAVARKPEKREAHTNPYVQKFLRNISWTPAITGVFGGKIDYAKYRFWDRTMIRFIMWMTKGPTDLSSKVDFTDWNDVEAFGNAICELGRTKP